MVAQQISTYPIKVDAVFVPGRPEQNILDVGFIWKHPRSHWRDLDRDREKEGDSWADHTL